MSLEVSSIQHSSQNSNAKLCQDFCKTRRALCLGFGMTSLLMESPMLFAQRINQPRPQRILTIGASVSEIVCALGLESKIIGVDTSSNYPSTLKALPQVGYFRNLSTEGLLSLKPDMVLLTQDAGPPHVVEQIRKMNVPVHLVPNQWGIFGLKQNIFFLGDVLNMHQPASDLNHRVSQEWRVQMLAAQKWRKEQDRKGIAPLRVMFLMAHVPGRLMVAGRQTAPNALMQMMGIHNPFQFEGYKPLSAEAALMANPQVILTTSQGLQTLGGSEALWKLTGLSESIAAKNKQVISIDASYLLGFGPRLPMLMKDLLVAFAKVNPHQDLFQRGLSSSSSFLSSRPKDQGIYI